MGGESDIPPYKALIFLRFMPDCRHAIALNAEGDRRVRDAMSEGNEQEKRGKAGPQAGRGEAARIAAKKAADSAKAGLSAVLGAARAFSARTGERLSALLDKASSLRPSGRKPEAGAKAPESAPMEKTAKSSPPADERARGLVARAQAKTAREDEAPAPQTAAPRPKPAPEKSRSFVRALLVETLSVTGSLGFAGLAGGLFIAFVMIAPRPGDSADLWAVNRQPSIVILDHNGEEIAARGARYGQAVAVSDLPPYLIRAILSTEDRRFYEHHGVDLKGVMRAAITNFRRGGVVEGGSTITQQLARNLFLSFEQTYTRKIKEMLLALWIEGRYSKDQILSLYLNRIYFGAGAYGIDAAARTYFGKSARDVTLSEAAMLAGLPKAPSTLAPTLNPKAAQKRADQVLENLRETGAVSDFEAREARKNPPVIASGDSQTELGYFFDYIAAKARDLAGNRPGDLIITTTLDQKMQRDAEAAVKSVIGVDEKIAGAEQAALVAYDVNGAMRAMVGGRSYVESQFNRATMARRQPGSAFKPFVYIAAMEAGLTPMSIFVDQPIDVEGWRPTNYTPGYQGPMRLTEAVADSVNTVAVQVTEYVGRDKVVEAAKRMGITSDLPAVPSIALGGVSVSLEELTSAYLPLADNGFEPKPYAIERIEDQNYEVAYQHKSAKPPRVLDPKVSEEMNHLLFQVINSGTGAGAKLGQRVAVGKTGTTNDWRDAWFIGYTAQLVAGVWVGNDDFTPMDKVTGGKLPAQIWKAFMTSASADMPLKPIKGAYPAARYADESTLVSFYTDVLSGFRDVRRDGDARRFERRRGQR